MTGGSCPSKHTIVAVPKSLSAPKLFDDLLALDEIKNECTKI